MTNKISTDQQLVVSINQLITDNKTNERNLETYLLTLLGFLRGHQQLPSLSPDLFIEALSNSFQAQPLAFEQRWTSTLPRKQVLVGFDEVEHILITQVVDLHEMFMSGQFSNPHKFLGTNSPRGSLWYNFYPTDYLECATAGTFHGRDFYVGPVKIIHLGGLVEESFQSEPKVPASPIETITWSTLAHFLQMGQLYE